MRRLMSTSDLQYERAHAAMIEALPELRPCYERLVADWGNFEGQPPGQYHVLNDTYGVLLELLLALPSETRGRRELLERAVAFGERMLASADEQTRDLGMDALAGTLNRRPGGPAAARELGGPALNDWFASFSRDDWVRQPSDELIDLWGVRDAIASALPDVALGDLPGISHPADYLALSSLSEARATPNGVILLSTHYTAHLYVVCPARLVRCDEFALELAAIDIAARRGGEEYTRGDPGVRYRTIPLGERVWNMRRGKDPHGRLREDAWIADELRGMRRDILDLLAGRVARLA